MAKIIPRNNNIIASDIEAGIQTRNGIIRVDDTIFAEHNIKPRWMRVEAIGPKVFDIDVGNWIFVESGRWSQGFNFNGKTVRWVEYKSVLGVQEDKPESVSSTV